MVHLRSNIYHVLFSTFEIVTKLLDLCVLMIDFFLEVLCFVLCSFNNTNYSVNLLILIVNLLLLVLKQLSVVHVFNICSINCRLFRAQRSVLAFLSGLVLTS